MSQSHILFMYFLIIDVTSGIYMIMQKNNLNKKSALCAQLISKLHMNNPICVWLGFDQIMQIQQAQLCVFNCLQHLETLWERGWKWRHIRLLVTETLHIISWKSIQSLWFSVQCKVIIPRQSQPLRVQKSSPAGQKKEFLFVCCSR